MRPRRIRRTEAPVNHDRWLLSFSDFITLLFAFFVVLFSSSYRNNHSIEKVSESLHSGFQEMAAFSAAETRPASAHPSSSPPSSATKAVDLAALRRELEAAMGQELKSHEVALRVTPEGFVISLDELGFFDSGRAVLLPGAAEKITRISKVLSRSGLDVRVEGHSDDQAIHTAQFNSNWELSTARAMAVMTLMLNDPGFDPARTSVAGYGQYRPVASNATPEGRRMNRRVDLVVLAPTQP
jgi:chemotaxis protein MotB